MSENPDQHYNLSLRLSEVLHDIGVNKTLVLRRRAMFMLGEAIMNTYNPLHNLNGGGFNFGSQTEGTTTPGLNSDLDYLFFHNNIRAIQDLSEWKHGREQYLMVQDGTTYPGYCLLQVVRRDTLHLVQEPQNCLHRMDLNGRVLLTHMASLMLISDGMYRHGPAAVNIQGPGQFNTDKVIAFPYSSWPKEAVPWLRQQNVSGWPTDDIKNYSLEQECFVVPVGSRIGIYKDLEWRISTSLAERCLMFSLNITQIRCYILMKMIVKTFVNTRCGDAISSFICKTVLFHCVATLTPHIWTDSMLVHCLNQCLQFLLNCILRKNCPHFIIHENNLLAGRISAEGNQTLVKIMFKLTKGIEKYLLSIPCDNVGQRLQVKSCRIRHINYYGLSSPTDTAGDVSVNCITYVYCKLLTCQKYFLHDLLHETFETVNEKLIQSVSKLCQIYHKGGKLQKSASSMIAPFLCTSLGCMKASLEIRQSVTLSLSTLRWFTAGVNSDFASSRLKLASALYSAGDIEKCATVLNRLERKLLRKTVLPCCLCYLHQRYFPGAFGEIVINKSEKAIRDHAAFCVNFLPFEMDCVPKELKYEMYKCTAKDLQYRDKHDVWMDWMVVDSQTYLYYLQYKVYTQLNRPMDTQRSLFKLMSIIFLKPNLGHKETALNLLGQCMQQQNEKRMAFLFFFMSLKVRRRNNASKWHICRIIAQIFREQNIKRSENL